MKNKVSPLQGIQLTSQQRYSPVSFTIAGNLAYKLAKIFTCASASCLILSYLWARCLASSKGAPITIARSGSATQNSNKILIQFARNVHTLSTLVQRLNGTVRLRLKYSTNYEKTNISRYLQKFNIFLKDIVCHIVSKPVPALLVHPSIKQGENSSQNKVGERNNYKGPSDSLVINMICRWQLQLNNSDISNLQK